MSEFVADNGVRVSDEMVSRWAGEAESGFEGLQVESFGGRAWEEVETEPLHDPSECQRVEADRTGCVPAGHDRVCVDLSSARP